MDITDRTVEGIVTQTVNSGNTWISFGVGVVIGIVIGVVLTALYFTKLRYYRQQNKLRDAEDSLAREKAMRESAERERDECVRKYNEAIAREERILNEQYAEFALGPIATPLQPDSEDY